MKEENSKLPEKSKKEKEADLGNQENQSNEILQQYLDTHCGKVEQKTGSNFDNDHNFSQNELLSTNQISKNEQNKKQPEDEKIATSLDAVTASSNNDPILSSTKKRLTKKIVLTIGIAVICFLIGYRAYSKINADHDHEARRTSEISTTSIFYITLLS